MKKCLNCNAKTQDDSIFCPVCGNNEFSFISLNNDNNEVTCSICNKVLPSDSSYCPHCGSKIHTQRNTKVGKTCIRCGKVAKEEDLYCGRCGSSNFMRKVTTFETSYPENEGVNKRIGCFASDYSSKKGNDSYYKGTNPANTNIAAKFTLFILVLIFLCLLFAAVISFNNTKQDDIINSTIYNGQIFKTPFVGSLDRNLSTVTIYNETDNDSYAYLAFNDNYNSNMNIAIYIKSHNNANFNIKDGKYRIYYDSGKNWCDTNRLFGDNTICYVNQDYLTINNDSWEITFTDVMTIDGNLNSITANSFPK